MRIFVCGSEQKRTAPSEDEVPEQRASKKARPAPADEEGALVESANLSFGRVDLGTGVCCQFECAFLADTPSVVFRCHVRLQ